MVSQSQTELPSPLDTGLNSLILVARLAGVSSDAQQIRHQFCESGEYFDERLILRAAKFLGLRAKSFQSTWERLKQSPLPAIAEVRNDRFIVVGRVVDDDVLVQDPAESQPRKLSKEQFEELWTGRLILVTKRSVLPGTAAKFFF